MQKSNWVVHRRVRPELDTGRVHPRVGLGRVGSGWVTKFRHWLVGLGLVYYKKYLINTHQELVLDEHSLYD